MDNATPQPLLDRYLRKLVPINTDFKRFLYQNINWTSRLIGIKGARGVGKTTMLLQHIKEFFPDSTKVIYASLDDFWFQTNSLLDLAQWADQQGITHLFLDEVHTYPRWNQIIKNIYDTYDTLNIVYTGSSMLKIDNSIGDLSRRQSLYYMPGLSFREYLAFEGLEVPTLTLNELLDRHVPMAMEIAARTKILPHFHNYLQHGYYPFYRQEGNQYLTRLQDVLRTVLDVDLPTVADVSFATRQKAKALLMVIAENVPTVPKLSKVYQQIETTYDQGLQLINLLDRADILRLYSTKPKSYKNLTRPEKIFLDNPNLMYALTPSPDMGTIRETFFLNQLEQGHAVTVPGSGDFMVDGKWLFEVGGKGKDFNQIANIPNSYLAVDDTEIGSRGRIPLWMFGLLY
ncbi:MAG: AAA family ATPase [Bacteroidales bacterium]|nr:AAA family ATPase [Bacteroidales bacterium]